MPNGVPVATVAPNTAKNAGILATTILGAFDGAIGQKVADYKKTLEKEVLKNGWKMKKNGWKNEFDGK